MKRALLFVSHAGVACLGFAAGVYFLPILIAPPAPATPDLVAAAVGAQFKGTFRKDLKGSDALHWGEGTLFIGRKNISLQGTLAPGPDYKLYLSPEFVETREDFKRLKPKMARVGDVNTFENFLVPVPEAIDPAAYTTAIVWCETFSMFISAAKYR